MNKIKKFIKENKLELQVVAYGTVMLVAGIYLGKKIENIKWDETLTYMGKSGVTMSNVVDVK